MCNLQHNLVIYVHRPQIFSPMYCFNGDRCIKTGRPGSPSAAGDEREERKMERERDGEWEIEREGNGGTDREGQRGKNGERLGEG